MTTYRVFRPTHDEQPITGSVLAARVESLDGKRIGLLWNAKVNADVYLRRLKELMEERHSAIEFVWRAKPTASKPMADEILEELKRCDAVVTAFGD